ncbi:magnesium transporter MRS2-11, chloroplastic isoform X2 [Lathyrus oleraceus]|uniref:magnesium transporter MRS2-11, chloroplastic isoform X2 n=1 Tax=Pisum sativum TaxID=3888 RepID=UPI0021CFB124|nr:magnesium transporter MRS2-11, chloroplastic isoform X2 [Pisum sativum]
MALTLTSTSTHLRFQPLLSRTNYVIFSDLTEFRSLETRSHDSLTLLRRRKISVTSPSALKPVKCSRSTEEKQWSEAESVASDADEDLDDSNAPALRQTPSIEPQRIATTSSGDSPSLGIREPVYEVVEVKSDGAVSTRKINRRQLLKSSGLRPRDVRSVDPSLFLTNSMPSLLVREYAILLNLGSLRAIAMQDCVLIFDYNRKGGQAFLDTLLPRLNPKNNNGGPSMPFEIEVQALLEALPNRITGDILEQLRISKQTLVELGSRAGALRQMLLDLLEDPNEIRRMCIMGRNCTLNKGNNNVECSVPLEKQVADEEEEEIEMLLENYLQRCESCHGQSERLLDSAREMEDSIGVSLSSRRLEVSRVELLLQVGTFCVAVGALVAGIFGMNLKSYLEERVFAFWLTTSGIIVGGIIVFFLMYNYLRARKIF